jgi:two-component system response regulator
MRRPVLIAEDDPVDAWLLGRAFSQAGIDVDTKLVRDGEEALDYLAGHDDFSDRIIHPFPDVLLLDLKMPRLDGFEVLRAINDNPTFRPPCIVVLTSSELEEDERKARALGADHFISKPSSGDYSHTIESLRKFWTEQACFRR